MACLLGLALLVGCAAGEPIAPPPGHPARSDAGPAVTSGGPDPYAYSLKPDPPQMTAPVPRPMDHGAMGGMGHGASEAPPASGHESMPAMGGQGQTGGQQGGAMGHDTTPEMPASHGAPGGGHD